MSDTITDEYLKVTLVGRVGLAIEDAIEDWPEGSVAQKLLFSQRQKVAVAAVEEVSKYMAALARREAIK